MSDEKMKGELLELREWCFNPSPSPYLLDIFPLNLVKSLKTTSSTIPVLASLRRPKNVHHHPHKYHLPRSGKQTIQMLKMWGMVCHYEEGQVLLPEMPEEELEESRVGGEEVL